MSLYWIVATQEDPQRLVELVERPEGLDGEVNSSGAANEQTLMLVGESITDPQYVKIQGGSLVNDNVRRIADAWARLRASRNARLTQCDWTQLPDSPVDSSAWATYRQALRDLPENTEDPEGEIEWPSEPE